MSIAQEAARDPHTTSRITAERAVLGAALVHRDAFIEAESILRPNDFNAPEHITLFEAMLEIAKRGGPIDFVTLEDELKRMDSGGRPGWRSLHHLGDHPDPSSWLLEIASDVPMAASARHYCEIVARQAALHRFKMTCVQMSSCAEGDPEAAQKLLLDGQKLLTEVQRGRLKPGVDVADVVPQVLAELEARTMAHQSGAAKLMGLSFGLTALDYLTGGLKKQTLTILAARTSIGKTAYATQVALLNAVYEGVPALIFSLEMGAMELTERMISRLGQVDSSRLQKGEADKADWSRIFDAGQKMARPKQIIISNTRTLGGITMEARGFRVRNGDKPILLVVDYLQLVRTGERGRSREEELAEISGTLKDVAIDLDCPVLVLAQLNRGPEIENRDPKVSDIRGSGAIEQDADLILIITRQRGVGTGACSVHVAKQRNGATGEAPAEWHGATYQLRDPQQGALVS